MDFGRITSIQDNNRHQIGNGRPETRQIGIVPKKYQSFAKVFDEPSSRRFPKTRPWDHAIDLKPDA